MTHRSIVITLVLIMLVGGVAAQEAPSAAAPSPSLTLAAIYGSNADYYGQTAEQQLPYLLANGSYRLSNGIYFSVSGYRLLTAGEPSLAEVDLSAGYEIDFNENLNGSIGYTRSFFAKNSPLLQASNENTLSASVGYNWTVFKSSLSSFYAFGTQNDVFLTLNTSKSMDLGSLFSNKDYISLEPGFEIASGTVQYLEDYLVRLERQPPGKGGSRGPEYTTLTRSASTFDLLSYNANILLGYNRNNYLVEAGYQLSFLGKNISATNRKPRSFFNLSVYYQF